MPICFLKRERKRLGVGYLPMAASLSFLSFTCRLAPLTSCWLTASFLRVLSLGSTALWFSTFITSTLRTQGILVFFHCSQSLCQKTDWGRLILAQTTSFACLSCCLCSECPSSHSDLAFTWPWSCLGPYSMFFLFTSAQSITLGFWGKVRAL